MNTQVAGSAEQQSNVAEEINRNIVAINRVTNETAEGAQLTAAASDELADLAGQLRSVVGQFKI